MRKDDTPGETTSVRVITKSVCDCEECRKSQGVKVCITIQKVYISESLSLNMCEFKGMFFIGNQYWNGCRCSNKVLL